MSQANLFEAERVSPPAPEPLARRMSPRSLEEVVGQTHLVGPGRLLRRAIESDRLSSAVFFGPPGCGKSALARVAAARTTSRVEEINAVTSGVADLRRIVESAARLRRHPGQGTLLVVDEIHHFNKTQQDALLPDVERGTITLVGLTTENPYFYVNSALLSRSQVFEFHPLDEADLGAVLDRALQDHARGLPASVRVEPPARAHLVRVASGDARRLLNALEIAALTTPPDASGAVTITLAVAEESIQRRALAYDKKGDEHYDTTSAFIKSMRGSDPDAALYWMSKMLEAGEDPLFLARRIAICASEDVGNAEPQALLVAEAAYALLERVGMPEGRIPLAQAAVYVACAPKSNAAYLALERATREVREGPRREVPRHLKDANLDGRALGHGLGYRYPHEFPGHHVTQEYLPDSRVFYEPTDQGDEAVIRERLARWRRKATNSGSDNAT